VYEELKTLGTFTDYGVKPSASPPSPQPTNAVASIADNQIALLERKFQLLNEKMVTFDVKLDNLSENRNQRDDIVLELFKMLKDNLDSRMQLLAKLDRSNNDVFMSDDENHTDSDEKDNSSKVSSLEKHIQKKN
jgi:hypothetical protein